MARMKLEAAGIGVFSDDIATNLIKVAVILHQLNRLYEPL